MGKIKLFLDTNVLLDHLANREGFYEDAAAIISMINDGYVEGIVTSLSIVNCAYVLPKHYNRKDVMNQIRKIIRIFSISEINADTLEQAVDMNPNDFEDAVQYISSLHYHPDFIITRDKKGFKDIDIPVLSPAEFIAESKK